MQRTDPDWEARLSLTFVITYHYSAAALASANRREEFLLTKNYASDKVNSLFLSRFEIPRSGGFHVR
jgi:hypothetical protein